MKRGQTFGCPSAWLVWLSLCALCGTVAAQDKDSRDYALGAGDIIRITVFEQPDMTTDTRISESGRIRFPLIGEIAIGGLSISAAEARVAERLRSGGFVQKPQVNILVTQFRSRQVSVLGQVNRPGRYAIDVPTKLSDILATAGGVAPTGADVVTLTRNEAGTLTRTEINQNAAFQSGDLTLDLPVQNGDVIFVARAPQFYIHGEVQRPGQFRLETAMTVNQALAVGGGVTVRGSERYVRLSRRDQSGKVSVINARLSDTVLAEDVIYVSPAQFYIHGEVQRPGAFRVEPNMTVMQALALGGGVTSRGTERGMKLIRRDASGKLETYDAKPQDLIQADDVIQIQERLF